MKWKHFGTISECGKPDSQTSILLAHLNKKNKKLSLKGKREDIEKIQHCRQLYFVDKSALSVEFFIKCACELRHRALFHRETEENWRMEIRLKRIQKKHHCYQTILLYVVMTSFSNQQGVNDVLC